MAVQSLPPPVEISVETKKAVIEGLKKVIETFQAKGLLDKELTYQDIISHAEILSKFIETYREHRDMCDGIVLSKDKKPVRDDQTMLICDVTLDQIQQLLVKTCAKKYFEKEGPEEITTTSTVTTKRFLFFKKTEQVERKASDPVEERKIREITKYMAFGWQLQLMDVYREALSYQQIVEVGEDLVALQNAEAIAALSQFEPAVIKKVKQTAGQDFVNILFQRPDAIAGISNWNREFYIFYRNVLGDKAWDFFSREKSFFNVVAALDKPTAKTYGDILCYIAAPNLEEMQRLNIDKTEVLIEAMKQSFGNMMQLALMQPAFAKDMLRKVVDSLLHMNQEKDKLLVATALTCKAIAPNVKEWLMKQQPLAAR
jgi:hypothetical protein